MQEVNIQYHIIVSIFNVLLDITVKITCVFIEYIQPVSGEGKAGSGKGCPDSATVPM